MYGASYDSTEDCLLVDAGCDLNGYVSDVTRCWPISGEWSDTQRTVYEALRDIHEQLLAYANGLEKVKLSTIYRKMVTLIAVNMEAVGVIPAIAEDNRKVGAKVTGFAVDLTKEENRKELVKRVVGEFGGFDSLIVVPPKNAVRGDIMDTSPMQFDAIFDGMLTTPFRMVQAAVPQLKQSENGSIVFVTSAAGYASQVDGGLHSVASSALLGMIKAVAQSAAKQNVRVNGVCTGIIEGDGSGAVWDDLSKNESAEQIRQSLQAMIPIGRIGRPSDAASLVEFLISEKAKYITGESLIVNGGVSYRL